MTRLNPSMDLRPTPRELRWFAQIDRHGPQSSEGLHALTQPTHRCKDTSLRRLQALREAGFLRLPPQQNAIAKADFHPHVYDLTPRGFDHLALEQPLERHNRPTGHWWHLFWVASITSAINISAQARGFDFIPARRILALRNVAPGIPTPQGTVVPDQIFALKTREGFLSYALEVDRGDRADPFQRRTEILAEICPAVWAGASQPSLPAALRVKEQYVDPLGLLRTAPPG